MHRILVRCVAATLAGAAIAAIPARSSAQSATCPGRALLTCWERQQAFTDDVTWFHAFELDLELFEISAPLRLGNPALAQFWRFETATAAARAFYEYAFGYELGDVNFEQAATIAALPRPILHPHGIVDRRLARALSRLMQAEQTEALALEGLVISLDRATEASYYRGRSDWVAWQMAQAARYARSAAAAIARVIPAQRAATRALERKRLLYGVGSADLAYAQRRVRRYGINRAVLAIMQALGLGSQTSKFVQAFERANFGTLSFSLTQLLSAPSTLAGERGFRAALSELARRVPPAPQPQ